MEDRVAAEVETEGISDIQQIEWELVGFSSCS